MKTEDELKKEIEEINADIERKPNSTYYEKRRLLQAQLSILQERNQEIEKAIDELEKKQKYELEMAIQAGYVNDDLFYAEKDLICTPIEELKSKLFNSQQKISEKNKEFVR